jgi:EmrB/QacA subfamily drug resistance transporter
MNKQLTRPAAILAVCCMSLFMVGLDATAVNVALPALDRDLDAGVSGLQWTIDAYTVVLASLLLLAGSSADRFGRRRVFMIGLAVFTGSSLLCSLAPGIGWLIAFRVLQAVGGSMLNPVAMSIVVNTFTDPRERARAVGVWGATFGLSMALGPIVGGALVEALGWRAIFWLNVPFGLLAIVLATRVLPESRAERPRRFDPVGQVLVVALLGGLTFAIIEGEYWVLAAAALALVGLLRYEPRRADPLIDLRFFRSVPFAAAIVLCVSAFAAFGGFLFLNTLSLQQERGLSPLQAGLATAPLALMTVIASPLSGRLVGSRGPRVPLLIAGVALVAACLLLTGLDATTPLAGSIVAYMVFGIGMGFVNAPVTNTAVSGMPRAQAGVAAATATTSRQVGFALGVAVAGAAGAGASWWVLAGCGALVLLLGLAATTTWAKRSARRTAAELNPEALVA